VPILRFQQILRIASRNFWRFRLQAVLIIVATMTGSAGVIVSTGYSAGGRQKILDQFGELGTNVIIVTPHQSRAVGGRARTGSVVTTLNDSDYKAIQQSVDGISSSSPTVSTVFRIRAGDLTKNTTVIGCSPDYFAIKHWPVTLGALFNESAARQNARIALLGATAARDLFGVSQKMRQPRMHWMDRKLTNRSAVRSFDASARQPDFRILWKVSIFQRDDQSCGPNASPDIAFTRLELRLLDQLVKEKKHQKAPHSRFLCI
jgi:ABC-type antimicrobial peptide transport system permease subunit